MREIKVSNTLGGKKETLKPLDPGKIKMYACGVTTYDHYHIGHALQAIYFDVIRNYLEFEGYDVTYVRNYTDVDDKIIDRAKQQGISPAKLAQEIIDSSEEDMEAIGCRAPCHAPRVSQMIPQIIKMVETLIEKEAAYPTACGDVYYRVRKKSDYGKLSNRNPDDMRSGTRDIVQGEKEDELDFALWKKDDTPDASWDSPWGVGRPGWHIECSVMAKEILGDTLDIHGGGRDLIFPHHENEIAQSESANEVPFAKCWLHSGLLTINQQKMSKSLGNQITLKDFLKDWPAEVLRLAFLQCHYGSNIDFKDDTFLQAYKRLCYYYDTMKQLKETGGSSVAGEDTKRIKEEFSADMSDDFNTCQALGNFNKEFKKANDLLKSKSQDKEKKASELYEVFRELFSVFGLLQEDPATFLSSLNSRYLAKVGISEDDIQTCISKRAEARKTKDFQTSDKIRDDLLSKGITLMDTPTGTVWKVSVDG